MLLSGADLRKLNYSFLYCKNEEKKCCYENDDA
jgi:hypothetical protein